MLQLVLAQNKALFVLASSSSMWQESRLGGKSPITGVQAASIESERQPPHSLTTPSIKGFLLSDLKALSYKRVAKPDEPLRFHSRNALRTSSREEPPDPARQLDTLVDGNPDHALPSPEDRQGGTERDAQSESRVLLRQQKRHPRKSIRSCLRLHRRRADHRVVRATLVRRSQNERMSAKTSSMFSSSDSHDIFYAINKIGTIFCSHDTTKNNSVNWSRTICRALRLKANLLSSASLSLGQLIGLSLTSPKQAMSLSRQSPSP